MHSVMTTISGQADFVRYKRVYFCSKIVILILFHITDLIITASAITKSVITKFVITEFVITEFVFSVFFKTEFGITLFVMT